jgi:DivIVA domain-containing protein
MAHGLLWLLIAIMVGVAAYGVTWIITGRDRGLDPEEPDGRAVPLPTSRPLVERDVQTIRFDTALRGYRMDQVDAATKRAAYDIGYKEELIGVLEAELAALRGGEIEEADALRAARESAVSSSRAKTNTAEGAKAVFADDDDDDDSDTDPGVDTVVGSITVTDLGEQVRTTLGADKTRDRTGIDPIAATSAAIDDDDDDVADDEPAIRPGATDPEASEASAAAASRR